MRDFAHQKAHMRFTLLALGDIARRADHANGFAVVEERTALRQNPTLHAIFDADDAIFDFVVALASWVCGGQERTIAALDIGGIQRLPEKFIGGGYLVGQAPERAHALVPNETATDEVPFPDADLAGFEGERRALECLAQIGGSHLLDAAEHADAVRTTYAAMPRKNDGLSFAGGTRQHHTREVAKG